MKKLLKIVGIFIALVIVGCLSVVIGKNVVASKIKPNTANVSTNTNVAIPKTNEIDNSVTDEENKSAKKVDDTKDFVYEKEVKEINETYDKENNYTFEDKIRLPYININSEDAERTNSKLQEKYNSAKNSMKKEEYGFNFTRMDYEEHIVPDKYIGLSVCEMPVHVPGGDFLEDYTLYNFDIQDGGKKLTKREVIEKFNLTPNELEEKVKEALKKNYYEYDYADEDFGTFDEYMSNSKYHFENLQVLITSEKTLDVYFEFPIGPEGIRTGVLSIDV